LFIQISEPDSRSLENQTLLLIDLFCALAIVIVEISKKINVEFCFIVEFMQYGCLPPTFFGFAFGVE
jgi:hypothetical protein